MGSEVNLTYESLLDAAISLFSAKGYAAVGIREIAEEAHANIASIKYHFGSKHDLYMAAVNRVMTRSDGASIWEMLSNPPSDPEEAAICLVRFIKMFLVHLIPPGSTVESSSSLMIREALQPSEAIDAVVHESIVPNNVKLIGLLAVLCPEASRSELEHLSGCVLGQVLHIRVFRPFVERLRNVDLSEPQGLNGIARHIATFSLRGLGRDEMFISNALQAAESNDRKLMKEGQS